MSQEAKNQLKDLIKNINFDTGVYSVAGLSLQINDLSVSQMEELQDREAERAELQGSDLPAKEVLKKAREWQNFILDIAFTDMNIKKLKKTLSALEYNKLIEEVFVFLGTFTGPKGAKEFMTTSTRKEL